LAESDPSRHFTRVICYDAPRWPPDERNQAIVGVLSAIPMSTDDMTAFRQGLIKPTIVLRAAEAIAAS
jgi:hypothetical protein